MRSSIYSGDGLFKMSVAPAGLVAPWGLEDPIIGDSGGSVIGPRQSASNRGVTPSIVCDPQGSSCDTG